jgi:signal transduction histidine kinase
VDVTADVIATGDWDPALLEYVIANLLSNAIKYSPNGTPIDARVWNEGEAVHLVVTDGGISLTPDELEQLFQRNARASGAVQQGTQELGLGLYLSKGIIEAHGDRASGRSQPGLVREQPLHIFNHGMTDRRYDLIDHRQTHSNSPSWVRLSWAAIGHTD